jgi:hypothetical protein
MGPNASPLPRFRMAVKHGSLLQAEAAARELRRLELEDVLRLVLLYRRVGDPRFERAAVRFIGRVLVECRGLTFETADTLLEGLSELDGIAPEVARSRLSLALRSAGLRAAADYLASSSDVASAHDGRPFS